ncbi:MAG: hypothetical protein Q4A71_02455 [Actinomycetaceae bacterium]|nr:hypothetical protein [Actinomycetaceae bacterium]
MNLQTSTENWRQMGGPVPPPQTGAAPSPQNIIIKRYEPRPIIHRTQQNAGAITWFVLSLLFSICLVVYSLGMFANVKLSEQAVLVIVLIAFGFAFLVGAFAPQLAKLASNSHLAAEETVRAAPQDQRTQAAQEAQWTQETRATQAQTPLAEYAGDIATAKTATAADFTTATTSAEPTEPVTPAEESETETLPSCQDETSVLSTAETGNTVLIEENANNTDDATTKEDTDNTDHADNADGADLPEGGNPTVK